MGYKRYDPLTNDTIEILLKCERSVTEIAKITHVSASTIFLKKRKLRAFGTVNPIPLVKQGRPRALLPVHDEAIIDFLNEYLLAFVNEASAFL